MCIADILNASSFWSLLKRDQYAGMLALVFQVLCRLHCAISMQVIVITLWPQLAVITTEWLYLVRLVTTRVVLRNDLDLNKRAENKRAITFTINIE